MKSFSYTITTSMSIFNKRYQCTCAVYCVTSQTLDNGFWNPRFWNTTFAADRNFYFMNHPDFGIHLLRTNWYSKIGVLLYYVVQLTFVENRRGLFHASHGITKMTFPPKELRWIIPCPNHTSEKQGSLKHAVKYGYQETIMSTTAAMFNVDYRILGNRELGFFNEIVE